MTSISRRDFARFVALSGTATLLPARAFADQETLESLGYSARPLPPTPAEPDEKFWRDVRSRFLIPSSFGDDVVIESAITAIGRSSFSLTHRLTKDGALAVEGFDTRAWVVRDPSRPGGLRAVPLPDEVVARFKADPSEPIAPP